MYIEVITSFYKHVNGKETTSGLSIYTSFSTELKSTLLFTQDYIVVKVKISDLKVLEDQGIIKIYEAKDVRDILLSQVEKRDARNVFNNMKKNNGILIEGEIPDELIQQVSKDQIKNKKC